MFTARVVTSTIVNSEMSDSSIISSFILVVSGNESVGEKAAEVVNERKR
jgi:hypothetical protein